MAGRLHHLNIVTIYDVDPAPAAPSIIVEFVPGKPLDESIESGFTLQANGGRASSANLLADGISVTITGVGLAREAVSFSPETVQEFTVQTNGFDAPVRKSGGGQMAHPYPLHGTMHRTRSRRLGKLLGQPHLRKSLTADPQTTPSAANSTPATPSEEGLQNNNGNSISNCERAYSRHGDPGSQ